jgi:riboflavin synthase
VPRWGPGGGRSATRRHRFRSWARNGQCKFHGSRVKATRRPAACSGRFRAAAARISPLFTGLVECTCPVRAAEDRPGARRLALDLSGLRGTPRGADPPPRLGDSLAIHGCCLTVAALEGPLAAFDVVTETLACTNLGALRPGSRVHVERSLRLGDPLDGHLVAGHVERTGRVAEVRALPGETRLLVECGPDFAARTLPKGSVAVDGVSLTVAALAGTSFEVMLIPHTLAATTLHGLAAGQAVNIETDVIGKYVVRSLALRGVS